MAIDKRTLERAIEINTDRVRIARERSMQWNERQRRFLSCAAGNSDSQKRWYVVSTDYNCEKVVHKLLQDAGIEAWLPVQVVRNPRRGSQPAWEKHLICWPGYIFVNVVPMPESWAGLSALKHVQSILADGDQPIAMRDKMITYLKDLVARGEIFRKEKGLGAPYKHGQKVVVKDGPFASIPAIVEYCEHDDDMVMVEVGIFGRSTPVWLDLDQIEKV